MCWATPSLYIFSCCRHIFQAEFIHVPTPFFCKRTVLFHTCLDLAGPLWNPSTGHTWACFGILLSLACVLWHNHSQYPLQLGPSYLFSNFITVTGKYFRQSKWQKIQLKCQDKRKAQQLLSKFYRRTLWPYATHNGWQYGPHTMLLSLVNHVYVHTTDVLNTTTNNLVVLCKIIINSTRECTLSRCRHFVTSGTKRQHNLVNMTTDNIRTTCTMHWYVSTLPHSNMFKMNTTTYHMLKRYAVCRWQFKWSISMVQPPSKCFWGNQWVSLLAWGFLLLFYGNYSHKMHVFELQSRDKQSVVRLRYYLINLHSGCSYFIMQRPQNLVNNGSHVGKNW